MEVTLAANIHGRIIRKVTDASGLVSIGFFFTLIGFKRSQTHLWSISLVLILITLHF